MTLKAKKKFSLQNFWPYLLAFLVPVIVMVIVCIERKIWPFGVKCFLRTDLYHQYAPFFKELRTKLTTGGSLFYSWNIGGGTNFWSLSAYYLASPLNYLIVLVPEAYVIEFVTSLIIAKIGFCSVTMTYYLNKRHENTGANMYYGVFFGVFYALSGWMSAYNWNIMWLDCIWCFPLVMLGLERLVKENKGLLYCVSLGFTIFTNYYIAIMICMGVAIYCFFLLATEKAIFKDFGIKLGKFVLYTALAVGFASVFLIPYIRYFSMTASASSTFKWQWYSYFSLFDMVARQLINVETHTGLDHWPNIYSGMAIFLLIPLYFMNRKITLREKIGYTVLIIFFYFSFSTRAMDYIWHVLHIPNSLPCRQSFIFIFLILVMAYRGFIGLEERTYRDVGFAMIAALAFIFLAEKLETDTKVFTNYVIYMSAVFVILYAVMFYLMKRKRIYQDIIIIVFIALAAVEATVNTSVTSVSTVTRSDYTCYDEGVSQVMDNIREKEGDNSFYRVEKYQFRTKNDGAWLDYPSISTFSSCANANLTELYKTLGMEASMNAYGSMGQTFLTNMLMNVRYSIYMKEQPESDLYTLVGSNGTNVWVYENKYTLNLGYLFEDPYDLYGWSDTASTPLKNQNELVDNVLDGSGKLFVDVTPDYNAAKSATMKIPEDGYYYAYSPKTGPKEMQVENKNANFSRKFSNLNRGYTMQLGYMKAGDTLSLENKEDESSKSCNITLYRMDEEVLKQFYEALSKTQMTVNVFEDTYLSASIDVPAGGGLLMTTVNNEEGWEVYVDGELAEKEVLKGAYIGLTLKEGSHKIEFKYHVPYFMIGLLITCGCTLIMIGIGVGNILLQKWKKKKKEAEEASDELEIVELEESADSVEVPTTNETTKETVSTEAPSEEPAEAAAVSDTSDSAEAADTQETTEKEMPESPEKAEPSDNSVQIEEPTVEIVIDGSSDEMAEKLQENLDNAVDTKTE